MPIPPAKPHYKSNLTKQERQEQTAALYGAIMPQAQFTPEQISQMRDILAAHDAEKKPLAVVDLNNPPRELYRHQKFPMMVYDLDHSKPEKFITKAVHDEEDLREAIDAGWSVNPPEYREERLEPLSASFQMEAEELDKVARRKKTAA